MWRALGAVVFFAGCSSSPACADDLRGCTDPPLVVELRRADGSYLKSADYRVTATAAGRDLHATYDPTHDEVVIDEAVAEIVITVALDSALGTPVTLSSETIRPAYATTSQDGACGSSTCTSARARMIVADPH